MPGQLISRHQYLRLLERAASDGESLLTLPATETRRFYNKSPYLVAHRLHEQELFGFPAVCRLAKRMPSHQVVLRRGRIPESTSFRLSLATENGLELSDSPDRFVADGLYLYVANPEFDPEYRDIIFRLLGQLAAAIRRIDERITWFSTYFFVSSMESVTPYHMDREMNYLLQIAGEKKVRLWNQDDPRVMSPFDKELILSYVGEKPGCRPEAEALSQQYVLTPGVGVHHPFMAPHLVNTTSGLSVSLAFTYRTVRSDRQTRAHHFNYMMRRLGMSPRVAGGLGLRNRTKSAAERVYSRVREYTG